MQDLLDPSTSRDIVIREMSTGETFVEGLCRIRVEDAATAIALLDAGGRHRAQARDGLYEPSSRSHAIHCSRLRRTPLHREYTKQSEALLDTGS